MDDEITVRRFVTRVCIIRDYPAIGPGNGLHSKVVEIFRCIIPVLIDVDKAHRCSRELTHLRSKSNASNGRPHGQKSG